MRSYSVTMPIVFPLYFALPVLAVASGSVQAGALIMGSYGVSLGLWLLVVMLALRWTGDGINRVIQTPVTQRWSHRINGALALSYSAYLTILIVAALRGA